MVKPHLNYDEQLAIMQTRGLRIGDRPAAMSALKRIGYYRFSAYTYPFRAADPDSSSRSEYFTAGATFEQALFLYDFDTKLRKIVLQALQEIEISFAAKIGYTLGKRHPEGHLHIESLDEASCQKQTNGVTAHSAWLRRYKTLLKGARHEEFVKHHKDNYEGSIPIWAATGFMDFGSLVSLYKLMNKRDRNIIAHEMSLGADASETLYEWLRSLNILRNHCAHNNRIWNRSTISVPQKPSLRVAPEQLHHLNELDNMQRQKIYLLLAITTHLHGTIHPESSHVRTDLRELLLSFGSVGGMTLQNTMGFPQNWCALPLWQPA